MNYLKRKFPQINADFTLFFSVFISVQFRHSPCLTGGTSKIRLKFSLVACILVPFLKQVIGHVVPVTEHLDALPLRVDLTFVADEKPFKIFTAVHITIILMLQREGRNG